MNIRQILESHIAQRLYNHEAWFEEIVDHVRFPYQPTTALGKVVQGNEIIPQDQPENVPNFDDFLTELPAYLVTIPFVPPKENSHDKVKALLKRLRDESFGLNSKESRKESGRLMVVLFANRLDSALDKHEAMQFAQFVHFFPKVKGICYRVFGSMWTQSWKRKLKYKTPVYPLEKAFLLLKVLKPQVAADVKRAYESSEAIRGKIPYQEIRERLKNHSYTKCFAELIQGQRPLYLGVMDDDIVTLRGRVGLFSYYDRIIKKSDILPEVMSTGYWAKDDAYPIVRHGMAVDMKVREALASVIPCAPYYPEPNLMCLLKKPLDKYSFVGKGHRLESRRFLENGVKSKLIDSSKLHFSAKKALVTSVPTRMFTDYIKGVEEINASNIGEKKILSALRGLSQVHFFPKMWADQVYLSLPVRKGRMTDTTKYLMTLFQCFDPISLALAYGGSDYAKIHFSKTIEFYSVYASNMLIVLEGKKNIEEATEIFESTAKKEFPRMQRRILFTKYIQLGLRALEQLKKKGIDQNWRDKLLKAAYASGHAIQAYFNDILQEE